MRKILLFIPVFVCFCQSIPSGLTNRYDVNPGETVEASISIMNNSEQTQRYYIKKRDYLFFADGTNIYGEPGKDERSNANWYELPEFIVVNAGDTYKLLFDINVPDSSSMNGTYWSIIKIGKDKENENQPEEQSVGLSIVTEYGVQIITDFESGKARVDFTQSELIDREGVPSLVIDMENTGDFCLCPELKVQLFEQNGSFAGQYEGTKNRLFPGTSAEYTVDFPGLENTRYKALVIADCGKNRLFGATFNLELE